MQKKSDLLKGLGNRGKPELDNLEGFPLFTMAPGINYNSFYTMVSFTVVHGNVPRE